MTDGANPIPRAKSWADEIDDLYHDATERRLRVTFFNRARDRVAKAETGDDRVLAARSAESGPAVGGLAQ
jgi:hypothetical protein